MLDELYLNLESRTRMVDFLSEWIGFAELKMREKADKLITDYDDGKSLGADELAEEVKLFAYDIWPTRFAVERFFSEEGGMIEWDMVERAVRRSTAHLMERFRQETTCRTLDELFKHEDFETAFGSEERAEIEQVRHHVREDYTKNHAESLKVLKDEGNIILQEFVELMDEFRKMAVGLPTLLQQECYSKITRFEDRCLFKGEHVPVELIKEELAYYKEQKEIPIEEEGS